MRIITRKSDLLNDVDGRFYFIIATPPHLVDPLLRQHRDGGGTLGSELSVAIVDVACQRLASGGTLLLYTGSAIINGQDLF